MSMKTWRRMMQAVIELIGIGRVTFQVGLSGAPDPIRTGQPAREISSQAPSRVEWSAADRILPVAKAADISANGHMSLSSHLGSRVTSLFRTATSSVSDAITPEF